MPLPSPTRRAGDRPADEDDEPEADGPETTHPEVIRPRARVSELEAALNRKDHELYEVRRQYEQLLAEREREETTLLDRLR